MGEVFGLVWEGTVVGVKSQGAAEVVCFELVGDGGSPGLVSAAVADARTVLSLLCVKSEVVCYFMHGVMLVYVFILVIGMISMQVWGFSEDEQKLRDMYDLDGCYNLIRVKATVLHSDGQCELF